MTKHVTCYPSGFDYEFRPTSYFDNLDSKTIIVASILGKERRKDVLKRLESGDCDPAVWEEWITESKVHDAHAGRVNSPLLHGRRVSASV